MRKTSPTWRRRRRRAQRGVARQRTLQHARGLAAQRQRREQRGDGMVAEVAVASHRSSSRRRGAAWAHPRSYWPATRRCRRTARRWRRLGWRCGPPSWSASCRRWRRRAGAQLSQHRRGHREHLAVAVAEQPGGFVADVVDLVAEHALDQRRRRPTACRCGASSRVPDRRSSTRPDAVGSVNTNRSARSRTAAEPASRTREIVDAPFRQGGLHALDVAVHPRRLDEVVRLVGDADLRAGGGAAAGRRRGWPAPPWRGSARRRKCRRRRG